MNKHLVMISLHVKYSSKVMCFFNWLTNITVVSQLWSDAGLKLFRTCGRYLDSELLEHTGTYSRESARLYLHMSLGQAHT